MPESKHDVQCRTLVIIFLPYSWHEEGRGGPLNYGPYGGPRVLSSSWRAYKSKLATVFLQYALFCVSYEVICQIDFRVFSSFWPFLFPSEAEDLIWFCPLSILLYSLIHSVFIATLVLKIFQRFAEVRHICYHPITCTNDANTSVKQDENRGISVKKVKQPRRS